MLCDSSASRSLQKKQPFLLRPLRSDGQQHWDRGSGGFRWMLQLLVDGCFFWRTRGLFFRLMDVHLLTRANVMLYFQQLLHADVTSSKCRPQRNGMSTCKRGQVACCTLTTSACRCDLIKIAARDSGSSTTTHCLWTKPGCACQKPTVIKAAAGQHWFPCEFPCNARATHVQHTCNTRATQRATRALSL